MLKNFTLQIVLFLLFGVLGSGSIFSQNALDANGKKTGAWVITGNMSKVEGYQDTAKVEEGEYLKSRKVGIWKKYWPNGNLKSEIYYENGRPTGDYKSFYKNGNLEEKGSMSGDHLVGSFELYYEDGTPKQKKTFNENGETDGAVIYWYENGQKELEFETINGLETGDAVWYYENGDKKKEKTYVDGAAVLAETVEFERKNPPYKDPTPPVVQKGPKASGKENAAQGNKAGSQIVDGYYKTYDDDGNILMDGEFKGGRLNDGRYYIYDEFGLLDHIEVYKEGAFAGNGVIGAKDKY